MDQHLHSLAIVDQILTGKCVSRVHDVTMLLAHQQACIRLRTVINFNGHHLLERHVSPEHFPHLFSSVRLWYEVLELLLDGLDVHWLAEI